MTGQFLFGYGSLINRASAARALGRPLAPDELVRAELVGYRLAWTSQQRVYSSNLNGVAVAVFLNLQVAADCAVRGVLLAVDDEELDRVAIREKGYRRLDVSAAIHNANALPIGARIYTFISPDSDPAPNRYLLDGYLAKVRQGCKDVGEDLLQHFDATTEIPEIPRLAGPYSFVDQAQRELT